MATVDFNVDDQSWTQLTNGDAETLIQLKSVTSSVRIAVAFNEPVGTTEGFILVPGNFEAISLTLNGEEVFARTVSGEATVVAAVEVAP